VDAEVTVFVELVTTVDTMEEVVATVTTADVVDVTVTVFPGLPPTVVMLVLVTTPGAEVPLPTKYAIAPTTTATTITAPTRAVVPTPLL